MERMNNEKNIKYVYICLLFTVVFIYYLMSKTSSLFYTSERCEARFLSRWIYGKQDWLEKEVE